MDSTAIRAIEQLVVASRSEEMSSLTEVPCLVLPEGNQIASLEKFLDQPVRMRRKYRTERIEDFAKYVNNAGAIIDRAAIFVTPKNGGAVAILDYGDHITPLWGDHRAILAMRKMPEICALEEACSQPITQRKLIDFLEDWLDHARQFSSMEGDEENDYEVMFTDMSIPRAVAAIRRVDIKKAREQSHEHGDMRNQMSAMESVEASTSIGKLPAGFRFRCAPYENLIEREYTVRLALRTEDTSTPKFTLRIMAAEQTEVLVAQEIEERIRNAVTEINPERIFVGTID